MKKEQRERYRQDFKTFKERLSCLVCGENSPECLDFHHIDGSEKEFSVSALVGSRSLKGLTNEIEKCIVLCANCHRKVHSGRIKIDGCEEE